MRSAGRFFCRLLATGLFVSYLPAAVLKGKYTGAGLLGAVWGWLLIRWAPQAAPAFIAFLILSTLAAVAVSDVAGRGFPVMDDPRIIIDETVGFWTAAAFLPRDLGHMLAAFVLFRVFDVWKPWPIPYFERLPGGWGVVLDDSAAGVIACVLVQAGSRYAPLLWH